MEKWRSRNPKRNVLLRLTQYIWMTETTTMVEVMGIEERCLRWSRKSVHNFVVVFTLIFYYSGTILICSLSVESG